ncbi:MAG: C-terminal helicase domain-containing protein, partial [Firmicutes bacterium]|nr:C-terminal helicase domain-containing protein [Bacillota bacterium]
MKAPEIIKPAAKAAVPEAINHIYFIADRRDKIEVLRKLARIMNPDKAIVFINKGEEAELAASKLKYHHLKAEAIHGASKKLERKKAMDDFKEGRLQLLVASDLAARGLDISGVTCIFSLDMPEDPMLYLHRAGRTGRAGQSGTVVSIISEYEIPLVKSCENALKISLSPKAMYMGNIVDVKVK